MKLKYYNILICSFLLVSCKKELAKITTPDFDVKTAATTYKVGEKIEFNITGEANIVSFYSGEPRRQYAFKNGRVVDATNAGASLSFSTAVVNGSQGVLSTTVPPQLTVMASTNFNGNYDIASVRNATWTNITALFAYGISPTTFAPSGLADVSDLLAAAAGKPIYIAYKYTTAPQGPNGLGRNWQIQNFAVQSKKNIGSAEFPVNPVITDQANAGFRIVNSISFPVLQSTVTASRISLLPNVYDAVNDPTVDPASESWAISKAIHTNTIDLGPDLGVGIKEHAKTTALTLHTYTYAEPGTYKVTFVAINNNIETSKEVVKEITITIIP